MYLTPDLMVLGLIIVVISTDNSVVLDAERRKNDYKKDKEYKNFCSTHTTSNACYFTTRHMNSSLYSDIELNYK